MTLGERIKGIQHMLNPFLVLLTVLLGSSADIDSFLITHSPQISRRNHPPVFLALKSTFLKQLKIINNCFGCEVTVLQSRLNSYAVFPQSRQLFRQLRLVIYQNIHTNISDFSVCVQHQWRRLASILFVIGNNILREGREFAVPV